MIKNIIKKIEKLYSENVKTNGIDSKSVGWKDRKSHILRFEKLLILIEPNNKKISINDYGCGYGKLLEFIIKNKKIPLREYNGYDISREMLSKAFYFLKRFEKKVNINLFNSNIINTVADYTIVCGTFNVKFEAKNKDWEKFIKTKLNEINRHSRKGFAFNLLTKYVDYKKSHLYYGDPLFWFDYCKRRFSRYVNLIHDYQLWEFTIIVKK